MNNASKLFKIMMALIITSFVIVSLGSTVSYADSRIEGTEANSFFISFIDEVFSDISKLKVKNKAREDITDYFLNQTKEFFLNHDYDSIHKIIIDGRLSISIVTVSEENNYGLMATRTQTFSEYEYKEERARNGNSTLVWSTLLTGKVTYDINTGKIISAPDPTLRLGYQSGGWEQPAEMTNVTTSKRIYNSYVEFSGRYKMIQDMSIIFDDGSVWVREIDYGTHTHYLDAYPDF